LTQDEIFHFYLGDPVTWLLLGSSGGKKVVLGSGFQSGEEVQMVVKAGTWFGGTLRQGGRFALMGTTVAPGFEFEDFFIGERRDLLTRFPEFQPEIIQLT
jgi:predicted cupin superfamily sugar epimerase